MRGSEPTQHLDKALLARLRRLSAHGVTLGAFDTGVFALAAAGLIRDRTATLHWEAFPVFRDLHPRVSVTEQLFVIDRGLATAADGNASLDLMLAFFEGRTDGALRRSSLTRSSMASLATARQHSAATPTTVWTSMRSLVARFA